MKKLIYIFCLTFLIFGCSNSSDDDDGGGSGEDPTDSDIVNPDSPLVVSLVFPHENSLCTEGTILSDQESSVLFEWQASDTAENYKIVVENLFTGNSFERETTEDKIALVINRATPYAWYVESSSGSKTEKSDIWKFHNAGPGVESYTPFPATIVAPTMAQSLATTSSVTLQWTGADLDNDIVGYDVYFGTSNNPDIESSDITTTELNVSVSANTIYYWKVITKDDVGHASDSGIFQFKVL